MTITCREGLFEATLTGNLLRVNRYTLDRPGTPGGVYIAVHTPSPLFTCTLRQTPWFVVHSEGLYMQSEDKALMRFYQGEDADQLLTCLTRLLTSVESKRTRRRMKLACTVAVVTAFLAWFAPAKPFSIADLVTPFKARQLHTEDAPGDVHQLQRSAPKVLTVPEMSSMTPSHEKESRVARSLQPPQTPVTADGWSLPLNVRTELPGKLRNAASRGMFTIPLSTGHARTIYIFADPACTNCQRMERHFETAAGAVNVIIFPVTIEGREASLKTLTSVMMLPEADRADAWKQLFRPDAGIVVPGSAQDTPVVIDEEQAETARGAIGINEVAFRAYRLPGTPWTISDDGRYVPQNVLSSPAMLEAFLNRGDHDGR